MENLLRWSIANSEPRGADQPPPQPRSDLDPGVIDTILGRPDSALMKEALAIAVDESKDEDDRVQALDNFEMLIEHIDNAIDLERLKMWEPLHALLTNPSSSEEIQLQVLWILGTAVQNNPAAQNAYLALSPLPALLTFLSPSTRSGKTRSKAVYALSGLLKHNAAAVRALGDAGGWAVLRDALQDPDITVRRKVAFLLNTLLVPTGAESEAVPPANEQQPLQVPTSTTGVTTAVAVATPASTATTTAPPSTALSAPTPSPATSQAITLHPSSTSPALPTPAAPAAATASPGAAPTLSPPQTVHPNSHASMVSDPSSTSTAAATADAFLRAGLLRALVSALAEPVPHGPDGEREGDADFEEKALRGVHTYVAGLGAGREAGAGGGRTLPPGEAGRLRGFLEEREREEAGVAERWNLTVEEVRELKKAVGAAAQPGS
ncbi:armadillo-type protein [Trametes maxima]|nr:armadillo-type protein [Trametes maxima]